ncbi:hypothetical protein HA402_014959 [Bradysia odoriphaga]|nr:hypothetical protein HA402_014959 [Bradysia odoriphaga]
MHELVQGCWRIEGRQTNSPTHPPGHFGDYLCDSPWSLLESATQAMKSRQGDNVEFVLWTGDGLAHSTRRHSESHRLELLRNITDLLGRTFSSQFVFPVLGHEDAQGNSFRKLGELWRHWLPSEALQTFEKGGYYTIEQTKSRLRIIVLNTNFMRHDGKYLQTHSAAVRQRPGATHSSGGTVSALSGSESHESQKQWDWLEEVLAKSNRNKETVYIVGHMPPGSDERQVGSLPNGHSTFSEKNNLRYLRLVRKYSNIILGQFFGHLHSDSFRIIYNEIGKPVSWIMIAPSVTPRKTNVLSNNPAMRLYKFDTDTGQVLDYTQYYLDLDSANTLGEATWLPEYNLTTQYFGSGEVNAVALHNLADRFPNGENPLFAKYYRANSVRYKTDPCEGVCALQHYCAITRVDYREFRQCLETAASALASSSKSSSSSITQYLTLVLTIFVTFKCDQRKLLLDWLHFLFDTSISM